MGAAIYEKEADGRRSYGIYCYILSEHRPITRLLDPFDRPFELHIPSSASPTPGSE